MAAWPFGHKLFFMKIPGKNLAFAGMTYDQFVSLWRSARRGDVASKMRLYELLKQFPSLQNISKTLGRQADKRAEERASERSAVLGKKPKNSSQWTRNQERLLKSPARVVSGGLPSLGKKA